jgi:hypothetical protein
MHKFSAVARESTALCKHAASVQQAPQHVSIGAEKRKRIFVRRCVEEAELQQELEEEGSVRREFVHG